MGRRFAALHPPRVNTGQGFYHFFFFFPIRHPVDRNSSADQILVRRVLAQAHVDNRTRHKIKSMRGPCLLSKCFDFHVLQHSQNPSRRLGLVNLTCKVTINQKPDQEAGNAGGNLARCHKEDFYDFSESSILEPCLTTAETTTVDHQDQQDDHSHQRVRGHGSVVTASQFPASPKGLKFVCSS